MYAISDLYTEYLKKRSRDWLVKVNIAGTDYGSSAIVDFVVENEMSGEQEFELGTAILGKLTLRLRTSTAIPPNARVVPYVALQLPPVLDGANVAWQDADIAWQDADFPWQGNVTEWLPIGEFYIDSRKQLQIKNVWEFTCYDKLVWADVPYISQLSYPASMQAVWDEICNRLGYTYDSSVMINPSYKIQAGPAGYSCRQVLGYIAGANAACVYISKDGILRFRRFGSADMPVFDMTKADYIRVNQTNPVKEYTRIMVTYNTEDDLTYGAGSGDENHTLHVENPFVTQAMTNDLLARMNGFRYTPVEMSARGYPQIEVGDRIRFGQPVDSPTWDTAEDTWDSADYSWDGFADGEVTLALNQVFTFRGGLKLSIDAPSKSEQKSEFVVEGTLSQQVNKLNKNAVREGRSYFGATITRTEGLTIEREDHASKVILNSDKMAWEVGGVEKLTYDAQADKLKFTGDIVMEGGSIDWSSVGAPDIDDISGLSGRLTHIGPTGIYTGTLKTDQLIAGAALIGSALIDSIRANQIDVSTGKITAAQIDATNLHVQAANIDGQLTASQINATNLHVNAANIDGLLTAAQIDATNLHVSAANIDGTITAGAVIAGISISSPSISGGTISGGLITGGTISGSFITTASTGQRIQLSTSGFQSIDSGGITRVAISPSTPTWGVAGIQFYDEIGATKGTIYSSSLRFGIAAEYNGVIMSVNSTFSFEGVVDFSGAFVNMPQKANAFTGVTQNALVQAASGTGIIEFVFNNGVCTSITLY